MTGPEKKFRAGGCSATVFSNEIKTPTGTKTIKNAVLERTYKDRDGNFQTSKSYSLNDIPKAILVLQKAYEQIVLGKPSEPSSVPKTQQDLSQEPSSEQIDGKE